jgi:hypothetical protein
MSGKSEASLTRIVAAGLAVLFVLLSAVGCHSQKDVAKQKAIDTRLAQASQQYQDHQAEWQAAYQTEQKAIGEQPVQEPVTRMSDCTGKCGPLAAQACGTAADWNGDREALYECRAELLGVCMRFCATGEWPVYPH